MGATSFYASAYGKDVKEAFNAAVDQALYDYGHRGYTGSMAEKGSDGFVIAAKGVAEDERTATKIASELNDDYGNSEHPWLDKWGPCGAIQFKTGLKGRQGWLFFGYASS